MKRTFRARSSTSLILAVALLLAACAGDDDADNDNGVGAGEPVDGDDTSTGDAESEAEADTGQAEGEPIVIGGTLGLTGAFADSAALYRVAYDHWLERVNEDGGLLGRPVELLIYDDESTVETAQDLYQRLIADDDVDFLLGPFATGPGGAILPVVEANDRVLWNGGFIGHELHVGSDNIIGFWTTNEPEWTDVLFDFVDNLSEDQRPQRVGIATVQAPFQLLARDGDSQGGGAIAAAEERGMEVVMSAENPSDVTDVSGMIDEAVRGDVEMFLNISFPNDGGLIAETAYEAGFSPDIYCACGSQVTVLPFWPDLGTAGEGVMGLSLAFPEADDYLELAELQERLQDELGTDQVGPPASTGLTVLQVLEQAIRETESLDEWELHDYVLANEFDSANGPISFLDGRNYPEYNAVLLQVQDGQNESIWPPDRATAEARVPLTR